MLSGQPVVGNALTQSPLRPRPCMHFHSAPPALCWPVAFSASIETAPSFSTKPCVPGVRGHPGVDGIGAFHKLVETVEPPLRLVVIIPTEACMRRVLGPALIVEPVILIHERRNFPGQRSSENALGPVMKKVDLAV